MHRAASCNKSYIVKSLLQHPEIDVNITDAVVYFLFKYSFNLKKIKIKLIINFNSTPLFIAAISNSIDCVFELLKDERVDIYYKNEI